MKITKSFTLIIFSFLLTTNCSKNETHTLEPPIATEKPEEPVESVSEVYFTLNIDDTKNTSDTDDWIIVHKSTGELLDFKPYEAGSELIFEALDTELTDKITVSTLSYRYITGNEQHYIQTYSDINKGSKWRFIGPPNINGTPAIGTFDVNIDGIPGTPSPIQHHISHSKGQIGGSSTISSSDFGLKKLKINKAEISTSNNFLISILDGNSNMKYLFINDVQNGDSFNYNYSEFSPFDSTLVIDLPSTTTFHRHRVDAFKDPSTPERMGGFLLNSYRSSAFNSAVLSQLKLGYLNVFDTNRTEVVVGFNDIVYANISYGSKPESIIIPEDASFVVENQSPFDFKFTTNFDKVIRKSNSWLVSAGVKGIDFTKTFWHVSSPGVDFPKLGDIPSELKEMYPNLDINLIKLNSSLFLTKSNSYQEFIAGEFVDFNTTSELTSYEYLSFAD